MNTEQPFESWPMVPSLLTRVVAAVRKCRAADPFLTIHVLVRNHILGTPLVRSPFAGTGRRSIHVELPREYVWNVAVRAGLIAGVLAAPHWTSN